MKKIILCLFFAVILLMQACDIKNPIAPQWDVDLNIPVVNRSYTLGEALKKDTSIIRSYTDPNKLGLLYYSDTTMIDAIRVGDSIKFKQQSSVAASKIDLIKVNNPDTSKTQVPFSEWTGITPPATTVIPAVNNRTVNPKMNRTTAFRSATFASGLMNIKITNNNGPITIVINNLKIQNGYTNATLYDSAVNTSILSGTFKTITINLAGKTYPDSLKFEAIISTPGSSGNVVTIPAGAHTLVATSFQSLLLSSVTALMPEQNPINYNGQFALDDSSYFQLVEFGSGTLNINFVNYTDLSSNMTLSIPSLLDPNGTAYQKSFTLDRKGSANSTYLINILLNGWKISAGSSLSNKLDYTLTAKPLASTELRTINRYDSIRTNFDISPASMKYFSGKLRRTKLDSSLTTYKIQLKDFYSGFTFHQIKLGDPKVLLHLNTSINFEADFRGNIRGTNGRETRTMALPITLLKYGNNVIELDRQTLSNFLSGFTQKLPDTLVIFGEATANPNYKVGSMSRTDSIFGSAFFEFPLDVGLAGGVFLDTSKVNFSQESIDKLNQANATTFTLRIKNGLPVAITVKTVLIDTGGVFLMKFPPNLDSVVVNGAAVDNNGNVINPAIDSVSVIMLKADVEKLVKAKNLISTIRMNTSRSGNLPVKFKISDLITITGYGKINYHVKP